MDIFVYGFFVAVGVCVNVGATVREEVLVTVGVVEFVGVILGVKV